jgi:hypothetical protein
MQGLSDFWARKYWESHWFLPSVQQGYEMLQRQVITPQELEILFRVGDIAPNWRDALLAISYNPITRVDIRRMHDIGVIGYDEMVTRYRDVGFSVENATLMADWTVQYNARGGDEGTTDLRKLTMGIILKGHRKGVISKSEATDQLIFIGFSKNDAEFILNADISEADLDSMPDKLKDNYTRIEKETTRGYIQGVIDKDLAIDTFLELGYTKQQAISEIEWANWEIAQQLNELIIASIRDRYIKYDITAIKVKEFLNLFGIDLLEQERLLEQWEIIRLNRMKAPTKTELKRWLNKGLMPMETVGNVLRGMGYNDDIVKIYLSEWTDIHVDDIVLAQEQDIEVFTEAITDEGDNTGATLP